MDEIAFRELFERTYPALSGYAYRRGLRGPDIEDLLSAVYEVAWTRTDALPSGEGLVPWLYRVAYFQLRNLQRRADRDRRWTSPLDPETVTAEVDDRTDGIDELRCVRTAIDRLSDSDRELILLVGVEGLSPGRAARVVGCSPVAARSRLMRARRRLRALMSGSRVLESSKPDASSTWEPIDQSEVRQ